MRFSVQREVQFDAGHRVPNHASKCRNPHGHRYRVVATFTGDLVADPTASDHGMVVDFGDLARLLTVHVHDRYDHGMVVWEHDTALLTAMSGHGWNVVVVPFVPTAENLAADTMNVLTTACRDQFGSRVTVSEVAVYETPTSIATVTA